MPTHSIEHLELGNLIRSGLVQATHIVGQAGGWSVQISSENHEHLLMAQRSGSVRLFKKLETVVSYLQDLGIDHFEVDASGFDSQQVSTYGRPDRTQALKMAHQAAAYETWFAQQVEASLNDTAPLVEDDEARRLFAERRDALRKRSH
ncbi:hypothetical protein [Pseudomonas aegrilactucae]|uniref:Uncharacterized protein n=1 Tax=Pseudomonas aegrilactucae TaxID=2854028 RepID=A0A9Q2XKH6_9PSED|nr:hypothetical protein [Pseudomonas aegrilactucae]MBV6287804.1 hypothetical protein [Pseudomonas aegrilactucae]